MATLLARSAKPAEATNGSNLVLGQQNSATTATRLDVTGDQGMIINASNGVTLSASSSAPSGFGVQGVAPAGYGITGVTHDSSFAGLLGFADTAGATALQGSATVRDANAGAFFGPVAMFGDVSINAFSGGAGTFAGSLTVAGNLAVAGIKSAQVRTLDGVDRLVYCVESTECWFEDFGEATLDDGVARITIDPHFAQIANMSKYHVFVTPYSETETLYVSGRSPTGFTVRERGGGTSNALFSYRIVARRNDVHAPRMARAQNSVPAFTPANLDVPASLRKGHPEAP